MREGGRKGQICPLKGKVRLERKGRGEGERRCVIYKATRFLSDAASTRTATRRSSLFWVITPNGITFKSDRPAHQGSRLLGSPSPPSCRLSAAVPAPPAAAVGPSGRHQTPHAAAQGAVTDPVGSCTQPPIWERCSTLKVPRQTFVCILPVNTNKSEAHGQHLEVIMIKCGAAV